MATPNSAVPKSMSEALDRMWSRFVSEIEKRLGLLDAAVAALAEGDLPPDLREAAHQAAHKLAGILGTFGLPRGTQLARQCEDLLVGEVQDDAASELAAWVSELRRLVENRTVRR